MVFCGFVKIFREPWMCDGFSSMTRHKFIPSLCIPVLPARTEQEKGLCRDFEWWREGWLGDSTERRGFPFPGFKQNILELRLKSVARWGSHKMVCWQASCCFWLFFYRQLLPSSVWRSWLWRNDQSREFSHNQEMLFSLNCWWFWSCGVLNLMMNRPIKDVQWKC